MAEERVQRRLAASIAADVVCYRRVMGADNAGTRARSNAHLRDLAEDIAKTRTNENNRCDVYVSTENDAAVNPVDAAEAAIEVLREIEEFNDSISDDIVLKIGIHRGPSIVVALNDRLDYLGK